MSAPWAAPGATAAQPSRPAPSSPSTDGPAPPEPLPAIPVRFAPMTVADVLDGAFEIVKRRPREVAIIAAATILPLQVVATVLFRDVFSSDAFSLNVDASALDETNSSGPSFGTTILVYTLSAVSLAATCAAITVLVGDWFRGIHRSVSGILVHTLRRTPALVAGVFLVKVAEALGAFGAGVGALVAMAGLHVVSPVLALETANPFLAMVRSVKLSASQWWRSLVVPVLAGIIGLVVSWVFSLLALFLADQVPDDYSWLVVGSGQLVSNMIVVPFTAGVAALYYFDLRIRREGLDIEERARVALTR